MAIAWTVYTCWKKKRIAAGPQAHGVSKDIISCEETSVMFISSSNIGRGRDAAV